MKNQTLLKGLEARKTRATEALSMQEAKRDAAYAKADKVFEDNTAAHQLELKVINDMISELSKLIEKAPDENLGDMLEPATPPFIKGVSHPTGTGTVVTGKVG